MKVDHREMSCEGRSHMELGQDCFVVGSGTATAMLVMRMCEFEIFTYTTNNFMVMKLHENIHHDMGQARQTYYSHVNQLGVTLWHIRFRFTG
jgi:hypothetical protein